MNRKCGYINKERNEVISCIYDEVVFFAEGLVKVKMNGKWGYINTYGETVIPFIYDATSSYKNDIAIVQQDNRLFVINKKGETLLNIPSIPELEHIQNWIYQ